MVSALEEGSERRRLGNRRVTGKEQFYTPRHIADQVVARLIERVPEAAEMPWLEPAGGTGTFIDAANAFGIEQVVSFDIEPLHPSVERADFLLVDVPVRGAVAIGNPPFGRNNALSVPFFNRAASCCDVISFIVPRSWRKWSVSNRLDLSFALVDDFDLSINYVDPNGVEVSKRSQLRTCVQTWRRSDILRTRVAVEDRGVVEKCSFNDADVSLTIFGHGCGRVKTEFPRKPNTTQMFLRLGHPRALDALQQVDFSKFYERTAYTEALAFPEINYLLNEYIFGDPGLFDPDAAQAQAALFG